LNRPGNLADFAEEEKANLGVKSKGRKMPGKCNKVTAEKWGHKGCEIKEKKINAGPRLGLSYNKFKNGIWGSVRPKRKGKHVQERRKNPKKKGQ